VPYIAWHPISKQASKNIWIIGYLKLFQAYSGATQLKTLKWKRPGLVHTTHETGKIKIKN
jgi:hypothetical protein